MDKLTKPERTKIKEGSIPDELKERNQWVMWNYVWKEKKEKWDKPPLQVDGSPASTTNPATWNSFNVCLAAYYRNGFDGIGYVFSKSDPYAAIDFDKVRDPQTGRINPDAQNLLNKFSSYCDVSPSQLGLHLVIKGKLPADGHHPDGIGVFDSGRYFCFTGHTLNGFDAIQPRQTELNDFIRERWPGDFSPKETGGNSIHPPYSNVSLEDTELIEKAKTAKNGEKFKLLWDGRWEEAGYPSQSEADLALCSHLAFWTGNNADQIDRLFRSSGLMRDKWDREDYRKETIFKSIANTKETFSPNKEAETETTNTANIEVGINLTDLGNAHRLVEAYGAHLRYCHPWNRWMVWDGQRWRIDSSGEVERKAKATVKNIYTTAGKSEDDEHRKRLAKHALRSESGGRIQAMIDLARSEPSIPIQPEDLDQNPILLNVANGTINLKKGTLLPYTPENYITKLAPVSFDPNAECPFWKEHLKKIFAGNDNLISYLQIGMGYSLTGLVDERVMFIEFGSGANGKTTTNETAADIMGDYAERTRTETLLVKREGSIPNDIAKLKGARFVYCSEAEEGKRLAESLIKDLSGGDKISARFMHGEWFTFQPSFKLWLATNHKPVIKGTDNAIWSRIRLIPFTVSIPECDRKPRSRMIETLKPEFPGILKWMVEGVKDWFQFGLFTADEVKNAGEDYRAEMDVLGSFITDKCEIGESKECTSKDLYASYIKWCEETGEHPITQRNFGTRLKERGFKDTRKSHGGVRGWRGIGIQG
jgi:putative DNA primase/helicase